MNVGNAQPFDALLQARLDRGADAAEIGEAVVATWHAVTSALAPVLGQGGVAALYGRCLHLIGDRHPWLSAIHARTTPPDLAVLREALALQTAAIAAAGGAALMQTLQELLASLIGPALTDELLRDVWIHLSAGRIAQDSAL